MNEHLEALFSPDRLQQNWLQPEPTSPKAHSMSMVLSQYLEVQSLIHTTYPDANQLDFLLLELTNQIEQAFQHTTVSATTKQKQHIVSLLEQLEELLWVINLPQRGK